MGPNSISWLLSAFPPCLTYLCNWLNRMAGIRSFQAEFDLGGFYLVSGRKFWLPALTIPSKEVFGNGSFLFGKSVLAYGTLARWFVAVDFFIDRFCAFWSILFYPVVPESLKIFDNWKLFVLYWTGVFEAFQDDDLSLLEIIMDRLFFCKEGECRECMITVRWRLATYSVFN